MKILITGGAGFIGSNFIFYMMDRYPEYEFVCVDKLTYAGSLDTIRPVLDRSNFVFYKFRMPAHSYSLPYYMLRYLCH